MDDYLAQCDEFGGGLNNLQTWQELRALLSRRNGWRFEVANTPHPTAAWCFGLAGACRFIVTLVQGQVCLYVHETDTEHFFSSVEDLEPWLEENEEHFQGFTPLQEELMDYLLPLQVEKWVAEEE